MIQFTNRFIFVLTKVNHSPLAWLRGLVESGGGGGGGGVKGGYKTAVVNWLCMIKFTDRFIFVLTKLTLSLSKILYCLCKLCLLRSIVRRDLVNRTAHFKKVCSL